MRKTCRITGKIRFGSPVLARIALNKAIAEGRPEKRRYQCEFCRGWHLTSQDYEPSRRAGQSGSR